jgi:mannose-6-phosphate isomerase-like protein (cupin superfamily)
MEAETPESAAGHLKPDQPSYAPQLLHSLGVVYIVIAGSGQVKLGDEVQDLHQWDVIRVAPTMARGFASASMGLG